MYLDNECFPGEDSYIGEDVTHWVMWDGDKPVAYCSLRLCKYGEVFMARAGVLNSHRGRGLHRRMIKARLQFAKRKGYKHAVTYVEKFNPASVNNLMRCGFKYYNPDYEYAGKDFLYFILEL
jgi:GNAT superfamily N-acetyltransferase